MATPFLRAVSCVLALSLAACAVQGVQVELRVVDGAGQPLAARVHVRTSAHLPYPGHPDPGLLSHGSLGSYFYCPGTTVIDVPAGTTDITVGRGFEHRPVRILPWIARDTTLIVQLERPIDLRPEGWFSADPHMHTRHSPHDYVVGPADLHFVARCEGLDQIWGLDYDHEFTGTQHAVSTPEAGVYYSTEFRNQAYGHVAMLGLKELMGYIACVPEWGNPASPTLTDLWLDWSPQWDELMLLLHPQTGADFFADSGWPACGLGRELPVLAGQGRLAALDVLSYSNEPECFTDDWYRLLNCGLRIPAAAGTDAVLCSYGARPPGGYRTYVLEEPGAPHDVAGWVAGLKAGRSFVTNYPLLPRFEVSGAAPGECLELPAGGGQAAIALRVASVLPLSTATIVYNGSPLVELPLAGVSGGVSVDTTVTAWIDRSGWLALRVEGQSTLRHCTSSALFAHTSPVYVRVDQRPVESTADAGYFLDWVDSLEIFADLRGNWEDPQQRPRVMSQLAEGRGWFAGQFHTGPGPFRALAPSDGDTVVATAAIGFAWAAAMDPEPGDRVAYAVQIATDSTFTDPLVLACGFATSHEARLLLPQERHYWWRVEAVDRGGWTRRSDAPARRFWFGLQTAAAGDERAPGAARIELRPRPNPSAGRIDCGRWSGGPAHVSVWDAGGRSVLGPIEAAGAFVWDGRDRRGRPVPSGCYWVRVDPVAGRAGDRAPVLILR